MGLLTKPYKTNSVVSAVLDLAHGFLRCNKAKIQDLPPAERWRACLGAVVYGSLGGDEDLLALVAPLGYAPCSFHVRELAAVYPPLLGYVVEDGEACPNLVERKKQGAYYTPPKLARRLAELAVCEKGAVLDPACGAGALLLAAGERLGKASVQSLHGMDSDPIAVFLCRHALRDWAGLPRSQELPHIRVGDALARDWTEDERFEAVVANPPFGNVVEGMVPESAKRIRAERFPELGGTSDYAYYFSSLAIRLLKSGGRAALIQPRAFVSANAIRVLREERVEGSELASVEEYYEPDMFDGAAVYVCIATFENRSQHPGLPFEAASKELSAFELTASMTVAQAYAIRDLIEDGGEGFRLVTTGLIDPGECLWGQRRCRYLKKDYSRPVVPRSAPLLQRLERARRPKLIVAGLSSRLEAFYDEDGECLGAVSTYTITHRDDDCAELRRLLSYLLSPEASLAFKQQLGASAMGGGNITLTKAFLSSLLSQAS